MNFLFVSHYKDFYEEILPQFLRKNFNLDFSDSVEKATQLLRKRSDYDYVVLHYNSNDPSEVYGISLLEHLALTGQTFNRISTKIVSIVSMDENEFFERVFYAQSSLELFQEQEVRI